MVDRRARRVYYQTYVADMTYAHGKFTMSNGTTPFTSIHGVLGQGKTTSYELQHIVKGRVILLFETFFIIFIVGCFRDPSWPWYRQPLPFWTVFFLVPIYSTCSSLSNLQIWDFQLIVMVAFSCCSYAANRATSIVLPGRTDIISAAGAFVIGSLGNVYSRLIRGTAFTSMVTGVLFLVPVSGALPSKFSKHLQYS